jgi:Trk K+ transport system NAD-binding subunit
LKRAFRCGVLARAGAEGAWRRAFEDGERFEVGEQVLVGGILQDVLDLARRNSRLFESVRPRPRPRPAHLLGPTRRQPRSGPRHVTLLPMVGVALTALLGSAVIVFGTALQLSPVDALYLVINTAHGNATLAEKPAWMKLFGCAVMIAGGALLAVLFSHLTSVATAERLEEQMGRRARRLSGHVVVAGLGNVGYRVNQLLSDLGLPSAVLELVPNARFVEAVRQRSVVLSGDARLPENLERVAIQQAAIFLACTDDDLTNVLACLHARRLNPKIRTVARIFDDLLAERLTAAFQIDAAISSGKVTAGAFVGAATDERALRPFRVGDQSFLAFRYDVAETLPLEQIEQWRAEGLRILAFRRGSGDAQPPSFLAAPLEPGDEAILAGPEATLRALLLDE